VVVVRAQCPPRDLDILTEAPGRSR
jgi:hypothetical protein